MLWYDMYAMDRLLWCSTIDTKVALRTTTFHVLRVPSTHPATIMRLVNGMRIISVDVVGTTARFAMNTYRHITELDSQALDRLSLTGKLIRNLSGVAIPNADEGIHWKKLDRLIHNPHCLTIPVE